MNLAYLLSATRETFGQAPRSFSLFSQLYNRVYPPMWMIRWGDDLRCVYRDQRKLFKEGKVVWGHIVQANNALFEPGKGNYPADMLYSLDPYFDNNLEALERIAHRLYGLKGKEVEDEEARYFSDAITDEHTRVLNVQLPKSLSGGREVYFTTFMVHRKHLPTGYLVSGWFPILALPGASDATMILPSKYWAADLIPLWNPDTGAVSEAVKGHR